MFLCKAQRRVRSSFVVAQIKYSNTVIICCVRRCCFSVGGTVIRGVSYMFHQEYVKRIRGSNDKDGIKLHWTRVGVNEQYFHHSFEKVN